MANPNTDLISADALDVTKYSALGAALVGVISGVVAVIAKLQTTWPMSVLVALIAFAAVAFVVMGAIVITDMLVRRDLAKSVLPTTGNDPAIPLQYQIWRDLKPELEKAAPAIEAVLTRAAAEKPATATLEDVVWQKFEELGATADGRPRRVSETVEVQAS